MAGLLLGAFVILLVFSPRLAWVALALAIASLVGKRLSAARHATRERVSHDASI